MNYKISRKTVATGNVLTQSYCTYDDAKEFVMYSHYDHTDASKVMSRAIATNVMIFGHPNYPVETQHFLWFVDATE